MNVKKAINWNCLLGIEGLLNSVRTVLPKVVHFLDLLILQK